MERHRVALTTDTTSGVTAYTTGGGITGRLINVIYYQHGTAPLTTTCDLTVSIVNTSQIVYSTTGLDASETIAPRQPIHNSTGSTLAFSTATTLHVQNDYFFLAQDHLKVTIVNGGSAKQGTVDFVIG